MENCKNKNNKDEEEDKVLFSKSLKQLRISMIERKITHLIIGKNDPHFSEDKNEIFEIIKFLTGFTGSNAEVLITKSKAFLWTDSRYFIQAENQLNKKEWTIKKMRIDESLNEFLKNEFEIQKQREDEQEEQDKQGKCDTEEEEEGDEREGEEEDGEDMKIKIGLNSKYFSVEQILKLQKMYSNIYKSSSLNSSSSFLYFIKNDNDNFIEKSIQIQKSKYLKEFKKEKNEKIFVQKIEYSGESVKSKITKIRNIMAQEHCYFTLITKLDDIAWITNLRGLNIVKNCPIFYSFLIISLDSIHFFVDESLFYPKNEVLNHLKNSEANFIIHPYDSLISELKKLTIDDYFEDLGLNKFWIKLEEINYDIYQSLLIENNNNNNNSSKKLSISKFHDLNSNLNSLEEYYEQLKKQIQKNKKPKFIFNILILENLNPLFDFIKILKATKNPQEQKGAINCGIKDGASLCKLFGWINNTVLNEKISINERDIYEKAIYFRKQEELFLTPSFESIVSVKSNCPIVHYKPKKNQSLKIEKNDVILIDSGGHYLEGTTDITRVVCLKDSSKISNFEKKTYTSVLKGFLNTISLVFPSSENYLYQLDDIWYLNNKSNNGILIQKLDLLSRTELWKNGFDFGHSTGHGVGNCLCVHEKPYFGYYVSKKTLNILREGMFITIEPGCYYKGKETIGYRIENDVIVSKKKIVHSELFDNDKDKSVERFYFSNATFVPIETKLVDVKMLNSENIKWVNEYNKKCGDVLMNQLNKEEKVLKKKDKNEIVLKQLKEIEIAKQYLIENTKPII